KWIAREERVREGEDMNSETIDLRQQRDVEVNEWILGAPTTECEICGAEFYALLTNGRCTVCRHRHQETKVQRVAVLGRRLGELARSPRSFAEALRRSGRSNSQDS